MPPIANHGTRERQRRGTQQVKTARDCILLRRRREGGHADVIGAGDVVELFEGRHGEPDQPVGPDERPRLVDRQVAPADVDAVGAARLDEVRTVVEDEERAVLLARRPKRLGRGDERLVRELLVAQLDDVHTAAQRGFEDVSVAAGEHEIEPRAG